MFYEEIIWLIYLIMHNVKWNNEGDNITEFTVSMIWIFQSNLIQPVK